MTSAIRRLMSSCPGRRKRVAQVAAAVAVASLTAAACGSGHTTSNLASSQTSPTPTGPPPALHVVAVSPHHDLDPMSTITISYDHPLLPDSPMPTISPSVPGSWARHGNDAVFTPTQAYAPSSTLTVKAADATGHKAKKVRTLTTPSGSVKRAAQILAQLHYLPLSTTASTPTSATEADADVYSPLAGHFSWRWHDTPSALKDAWSPTKYNIVLRGALIAFQHQNDISVDGLLGPQTWGALNKADLAGKRDPDKYSYVSADLFSRPQTLSVWVDGSTALTSPVNGGIPGALTPTGTFPVYERLTSMTMSGTNPDGSHYSDPGVPWVNFFDRGSAIHGFPREHYGYPQSVGCLELPIATAARVYPMLDYGTLVTVVGPTGPDSQVGTGGSNGI